LVSGEQQQRGDIVKGKGGDHEHSRDPERELDETAGDGARARGASGAGAPRLPVYEVETVSEESRRSSDEERLVRRERRKVADPGAADAEAKQDERNPASVRSDDARTVVTGAISAVPDRGVTMSDLSFLAEILIAA
jgi:hypothetical protein